jgi:hypothetical protein
VDRHGAVPGLAARQHDRCRAVASLPGSRSDWRLAEEAGMPLTTMEWGVPTDVKSRSQQGHDIAEYNNGLR